MNQRRWLIPAALVVAFLQIAFLASMVMSRASILRDGREVMLQVLPIDPRDLLRGDYVVMRYNISAIPGDMFAEERQGDEAARGRTVFVRLKADTDGIWQPVLASFDAIAGAPAAADEVDIRGVSETRWVGKATTVHVRYGIERFYVPEGEGRAIERADPATRPFRMTIAVASDGTAQIKSLHDHGEMLYEEPLY